MPTHHASGVNQRQLLAAGAGLTLTAALPGRVVAAKAYLYLTGTERPRTPVFPGATDCHMHFFDKRVATVLGAPVLHPEAFPEDYRKIQSRIVRAPPCQGRRAADLDHPGTR